MLTSVFYPQHSAVSFRQFRTTGNVKCRVICPKMDGKKFKYFSLASICWTYTGQLALNSCLGSNWDNAYFSHTFEFIFILKAFFNDSFADCTWREQQEIFNGCESRFDFENNTLDINTYDLQVQSIFTFQWGLEIKTNICHEYNANDILNCKKPSAKKF